MVSFSSRSTLHLATSATHGYRLYSQDDIVAQTRNYDVLVLLNFASESAAHLFH